jgi:hypothetical protein
MLFQDQCRRLVNSIVEENTQRRADGVKLDWSAGGEKAHCVCVVLCCECVCVGSKSPMAMV